MSKVSDIDYALTETLKVHPYLINQIPSIIYENTLNGVIITQFTRQNQARTHIQNLTSQDFLEYILNQAVIIYSSKNHLIESSLLSNTMFKPNAEVYNDSLFPEFDVIEQEMALITNPQINAFLYYKSNPNHLYYLIHAISKTLYNPKWYYDGQEYTSALASKGEQFRHQLNEISLTYARPYLDKIAQDASIIKPIVSISINYENINRCLREVINGTQIQYEHNSYRLDGTLFATQDIGKRKPNQEDSVIIMLHPFNNQFKFLAVADGVGGLTDGEAASNYIIKEISQWFITIPGDTYYFPDGLLESFAKQLELINESLILKYNQRVGSTFVGAIVCQDQTFIINIGDSRAYTLKDNQLSLITSDESLSWYHMITNLNKPILKDKEIDNLRFAKDNNVLINCMGNPKMNINQKIMIPNDSYDQLLLFSDGVTDLLSQHDIKIIAQNTPREEITRALVNKALTTDAQKIGHTPVLAGKDNATTALYVRKI